MPIVNGHPQGTPAWVDLMTDSPQGARTFYGALFGWTFEVGGPEVWGYTLCSLKGRLAAGIGPKPKDMPMPSAWSVYFWTESADQSVERIKALGGQIVAPPMDIPDAGRMAMAVDPTGAAFGLWQPGKNRGAGIVDEPGAMTWYEVNTRDAEKARDFYAQALGLEARKMDAPGMTYFTLHKGEKTAAGVLQMDEKWPREVPPHWMIYFAVADTEAAVKKVQELGGKLTVPPFDTPYGRLAVVADPQGANFSVITLSQMAQQS